MLAQMLELLKRQQLLKKVIGSLMALKFLSPTLLRKSARSVWFRLLQENEKMEKLSSPAFWFLMELQILRPRPCMGRWFGGRPIQGNSILRIVKFPKKIFLANVEMDFTKCLPPWMGGDSALPLWV